MPETQDKVIIQSKADNFYRFIYIGGFIFFCWICYLTRSAVYQEPIELIFLIIFLFFASFALWSLIGIWIYFPTLKIFSHRLEVEYFGGIYQKTIHFKDISEVRTEYKKTEHISWHELTIRYCNKQKFKIYSTSYNNFNQIDKFLSSKRGVSLIKSVASKNKNNITDKVIIASMSILGIIGLLYFFNQSNNYELKKDDLVSIDLTLERKPSIVEGSKGSKSLEMNIKEYPDFRFNISGIAFSATDKSKFIENTEGGSKIVLTIDKEEYLQKLTKTKDITFWQKHFDYKNISIYGIKDNKQTYLTVSSYEEERKRDSKWGVIGIVGMFIYVGYELLKKRI